jgi:L,D-peptidoglycan transpeptidase YkuD (ErfK/YbiS/YcfS/YnhG family)
MNRFLLGLVAFLFLQCGETPTATTEEAPPPPEVAPSNEPAREDLAEEIIDAYPEIEGSTQLLVVQNSRPEATTGTMVRYEKQEGAWLALDTTTVNLGRAGLAPPGEKREGDGRTPSGLFLVGPAFGYEDDLETRMDFIRLTEEHHWISDSDSSNYNQLVEYVPVTKEMEVMRRSDHLYEYGAIIQYNTEPTTPGMGSAIFLHVERATGKPTAGCISMPKEEMVSLIEWMQPTAYPVILLESGIQ